MSERIIITAPGEGVAVGGRFDGWRMRQHPDGQWVSVARLEAVDPFAKAEGVLGMLFAEHRAKSDATPTPAPDATGLVELGERPCDCERCDCGNVGDAQAVAAWDERAALRSQADTIEARATAAEAERDAWRERESETQEALQKIGEEFGIHGGEPRVDGLLRVLREQRTDLAALKAEVERKDKALEAAEACMSIVAPRRDTAKYLQVLAEVRTALGKAESPADTKAGG